MKSSRPSFIFITLRLKNPREPCWHSSNSSQKFIQNTRTFSAHFIIRLLQITQHCEKPDCSSSSEVFKHNQTLYYQHYQCNDEELQKSLICFPTVLCELMMQTPGFHLPPLERTVWHSTNQTHKQHKQHNTNNTEILTSSVWLCESIQNKCINTFYP